MKSLKGLSRANNGEFRIGLGYYSKPDGKRQYKQFRLGKNLFIAQQISKALELAWAAETTIDSDGKKVWSQQSIDKALAFAEAPAIIEISGPNQTATQRAPAEKGMTLFQAFDLNQLIRIIADLWQGRSINEPSLRDHDPISPGRSGNLMLRANLQKRWIRNSMCSGDLVRRVLPEERVKHFATDSDQFGLAHF
jgi:hypothetical protein